MENNENKAQLFNNEMMGFIESLFKKFDFYSIQHFSQMMHHDSRRSFFVIDEIKINDTFFKIKIIFTKKGISYFECANLIELLNHESCSIR